MSFYLIIRAKIIYLDFSPYFMIDKGNLRYSCKDIKESYSKKFY